MLYLIYKTVNLIDGKFYLGKHQTKDINDSYLGSGIHLKRAIKKFGVNNFKKEILFIFDTEEEMNKKEKELITERLIQDKNCYNIGIGGEGGPHFKGKRKTKESIQKMLETRKLNGKKVSLETRKKISDANRRRPVTASFREKMSKIAKARIKTEEEKMKISETLKRRHRQKMLHSS